MLSALIPPVEDAAQDVDSGFALATGSINGDALLDPALPCRMERDASDHSNEDQPYAPKDKVCRDAENASASAKGFVGGGAEKVKGLVGGGLEEALESLRIVGAGRTRFMR